GTVVAEGEEPARLMASHINGRRAARMNNKAQDRTCRTPAGSADSRSMMDGRQNAAIPNATSGSRKPTRLAVSQGVVFRSN
ncbi:MAG: hypothetical protein KDH91_11325, partial [Rhodoferax sp.]|nr:hypothetical protein [Rhodoferax sp.]